MPKEQILKILKEGAKNFSKRFDPSGKHHLEHILEDTGTGLTQIYIGKYFSALGTGKKKEFIEGLVHIFEPGLRENFFSSVRSHIEEVLYGKFLRSEKAYTPLELQGFIDIITCNLNLFRGICLADF